VEKVPFGADNLRLVGIVYCENYGEQVGRANSVSYVGTKVLAGKVHVEHQQIDTAGCKQVCKSFLGGHLNSPFAIQIAQQCRKISGFLWILECEGDVVE